MKKIITLLILLVSCMFQSNAQLSTLTKEEYANYKEVLTIRYMGYHYGSIRYTSEGYILFGVTSNGYEDSMASIYLGTTKEEAIQTLQDLKELSKNIKKSEELIVRGADQGITTVFRWIHKDQLAFKTNGVAGNSYLLTGYLKYDKTIQAIKDFEEPISKD